MKQSNSFDRPTEEAIQAEIRRLRHRARYGWALKRTLGVLLAVAAVAVLVATVWMPVLRIYGASMTPTLSEGDIVVSIKGGEVRQGDLVAFYVGNKLLVKRCIALPGQWVDMDEAGNVSVDGVPLEETYLTEKSLGGANITFPYQVPENRYFCMGDHRDTSVDSRHTEVGCIPWEDMVGRIFLRIWPLEHFEMFKISNTD